MMYTIILFYIINKNILPLWSEQYPMLYFQYLAEGDFIVRLHVLVTITPGGWCHFRHLYTVEMIGTDTPLSW